MKECYPVSMRGQEECSPWFKRFGHPTHHLVRVAVEGELPPDDITGFAQVRSFRFVSNIHSVIPVWYGKHFACRSGKGCGKTKGWTPIVLLRYLLEADILESVTIGEAIISLTKQTKVWLPKNRDISCAIIGKFTQGNKVEEKRLTHRVVIDEGELDFLIQDCIKEGTYAGSDKCLLGHILTYYEGHQPQYTHLRASMLAYAHINLLEMLRRFGSNEVVRIATDSIYIRRDALYKIENVSAFFKQAKCPLNHKGGADTSKFQCPHKIPSCAMCEAGVFYSKEAVKEFAKEVKVHYVNRMTGYLLCNKHKPFVYAVCFGEWYFRQGPWKNTQPSKVVTKESEPLKEEKIREIQLGQWRDKDINMVVFTHTNALAKDFQNDRKVKAQTWHSFFRWNGVGEWTPERMEEKKFPRVVIWDELKERADYYEEVLTDYRAKCPRLQELKKKMRQQNNRVQSDLFREALPVTEKWEYLEGEWKPSDRILSAHLLSRRIASQKCLELHQAKYPNVLIPLIYRPRDGRKQNCFVQIPSSSEKKELVKNDIIHLPLNTLPDKFLKDVLADKKVINWELGYAMTIHTSQGMTLKAPQRVWVIDENLAWDNLIYLAVGRVEYLSQLIRVEAPPLPPEIAQEIEEAKKNRWLEHELRSSIQEKLVRYMGQDKEKGREFDLTVDYILTLKRIQEDKCALCLIEMKFEWDRPGDISQWTVDQIHNSLGHIKGNVRLTCLLCN
uniref:Uncharacterized protein n=1 Tax=Rhizophagus irregularis (strain DAOM 181602 / DAOM 197198 / MUCL 43194) TaxID=747089 RepID=U9SQV8_RHIID